jgi:hypothetical protein
VRTCACVCVRACAWARVPSLRLCVDRRKFADVDVRSTFLLTSALLEINVLAVDCDGKDSYKVVPPVAEDKLEVSRSSVSYLVLKPLLLPVSVWNL